MSHNLPLQRALTESTTSFETIPQSFRNTLVLGREELLFSLTGIRKLINRHGPLASMMNLI